MKIHSAVVKAFFTGATKFDYLDKNPFVKLDPITLTPEEFTRLLTAVSCLKEKYRVKMSTLILTMRWSGLAIMDAGCLRRDALGVDNRLRTYRKKTG